jgi:hypothetical protein
MVALVEIVGEESPRLFDRHRQLSNEAVSGLGFEVPGAVATTPAVPQVPESVDSA